MKKEKIFFFFENYVHFYLKSVPGKHYKSYSVWYHSKDEFSLFKTVFCLTRKPFPVRVSVQRKRHTPADSQKYVAVQRHWTIFTLGDLKRNLDREVFGFGDN